MLGFVWFGYKKLYIRMPHWCMAGHLCLAMVDCFGGSDEVAVLPGLGDLSAAYWLA